MTDLLVSAETCNSLRLLVKTLDEIFKKLQDIISVSIFKIKNKIIKDFFFEIR